MKRSVVKTGGGGNCTGKSGKDKELRVPVGTRAVDIHTNEIIGEVAEHGKKVMIAKGGWHGLGNARFKSSVNRSPRQKPWVPRVSCVIFV